MLVRGLLGTEPQDLTLKPKSDSKVTWPSGKSDSKVTLSQGNFTFRVTFESLLGQRSLWNHFGVIRGVLVGTGVHKSVDQVGNYFKVMEESVSVLRSLAQIHTNPSLSAYV